MTQIIIRNGVLRKISSDFTISAWDSTVNKDIAWDVTSFGYTYSTWGEYEMSTTKNLVSAYSSSSQATQSQYFLPVFYQPLDVYGEVLEYPLMAFNQESAIRYAGSSNIFVDNFSYTAIARFESLNYGQKAFVLSLGSAQSIGNTPLWTYADLHVYRQSGTGNDYIISRVGSSYKSTLVTGWDPREVHVYTLTFDGLKFWVSLDNVVITFHNPITTGGLWGANNYSSINTFWSGGNIGYLQLSDTYSIYTGSIGYHSISYATYIADTLAGGAEWNNAISELCQYRYKLPNPVLTTTSSTTSTTLGSTVVIVFGSYTFDGTQQFL